MFRYLLSIVFLTCFWASIVCEDGMYYKFSTIDKTCMLEVYHKNLYCSINSTLQIIQTIIQNEKEKFIEEILSIKEDLGDHLKIYVVIALSLSGFSVLVISVLIGKTILLCIRRKCRRNYLLQDNDFETHDGVQVHTLD